MSYLAAMLGAPRSGLAAGFLLRYAVVLPLVLPLSLTLGESPDDDPERLFEVPGGGRLFYEWDEGDDGPEVVAVTYSGSPEWLVKQEHPPSHWHELPALQAIEFTHTEVTEEQIEYIAQFETVEDLSFHECTYEGNALTPLERMTWLKSLRVGFTLGFDLRYDEDPGPEFYEFLEKLTDLEYLDLWYVAGIPVDEQTFLRICELSNLRSLYVVLQDFNAETLSNIDKLSQLEFLSVGRLEDPTPLLRGLRDHSRLSMFDFGAEKLNEDDVAALAELSSLEILMMEGKEVASLAPLQNLRNLRELSMRFGEYEADEFRWLSDDAPQLEVLRLWRADEAEFSVELLRGHKRIRELWLPSARLSEDDIAILESMPRLEELSVANQTDLPWHAEAKRRLPDVTILTRSYGRR